MAIITNKNTLPVTLGVALFNLKAILKLAGWSVIESSDGVTAFVANNGDTITSGGSGAGGMANTRAWFRIRMPGAVRELTFQWIAAAQVRIKYAAAGFNSGGAAITTTPAASAGPPSDNNVVLGGGTDSPSPTGADLLGVINRVSYWADNAAPYGWGMHGWSAAGANTFTLALDALISGTYPAAETEPYVLWVSANSTNFGTFGGLTGGSINACWYARTAAGTGTFLNIGLGAGMTPACLFVSGSTSVPVGQWGINPFTLKDDSIPFVYGRLSTATSPGYKGVSAYLQWTGMQRANLSTYTVGSPLDRLVLGNVSVPWGTDGVAPLL